eukprot:COSAG01_NODE_2345_length_7860_cov_23.900528_11_plen_100_part_00
MQHFDGFWGSLSAERVAHERVGLHAGVRENVQESANAAHEALGKEEEGWQGARWKGGGGGYNRGGIVEGPPPPPPFPRHAAWCRHAVNPASADTAGCMF